MRFLVGVGKRFFGDFPRGRIFHGEGFPMGELSGGILHFILGVFSTTHIRNSFYLSYFLFTDSVLHVEMLRVIIRCKFSP